VLYWVTSLRTRPQYHPRFLSLCERSPSMSSQEKTQDQPQTDDALPKLPLAPSHANSEQTSDIKSPGKTAVCPFERIVISSIERQGYDFFFCYIALFIRYHHLMPYVSWNFFYSVFIRTILARVFFFFKFVPTHHSQSARPKRSSLRASSNSPREHAVGRVSFGPELQVRRYAPCSVRFSSLFL
jgi:hypothetical protein